MKRHMNKKVASVFSNIGVGEAYLSESGYNVVAACELDPLRCKVYEYIYPKTKMIVGDITNKTVYSQFVEAASGVRLLIATPPCQGFSTLNPPRPDKKDEKKKKIDPRNNLIFTTFELINDIKPDYALIENVPQMLKAFADKNIEKAIENELPEYEFRCGVQDATNFDTPQRRKRLIILFSKKSIRKPWEFPVICDKLSSMTLREAIGDLPVLESDDRSKHHPWHFAQRHSQRHIDWMRHTPTGKSAYANENSNEYYPSVTSENGTKRKITGFANTYKRMEWDIPAPTLIQGAHMISSSNTVHPGHEIEGTGLYDNARTLSVYEAMIIMGLPTDVKKWRFPNPKHKSDKKLESNSPEEITLTYKNAMNFLGEGLCPKMLKSLVSNISD